MNLTHFIFIITLVAEILTTLTVVISILVPAQRIWPPNESRPWGKPVMLILFNLTAGGVILLGILDWDSSILPVWMRIVFGLPVWLVGLARTSGEADILIHRGPYRFSRNPQYLGFMIGLVGWVLLTNSVITAITAMAALPSLILVPFAEEPWLLTQYGIEFEAYSRATPRFFTFRS